MKRIRDNGHIPIVVGGTGFYIQALLYDIDFTADDGDTGVRKELASYERGHGAAALHRRLRSVDPASADQIHPNNVKRVIRALEFYEKTSGAACMSGSMGGWTTWWKKGWWRKSAH